MSSAVEDATPPRRAATDSERDRANASSNASTSASSARSQEGAARKTPPPGNSGPAVEVVRARFRDGAIPIAGSEVVPYVLLREVETGKQYEAPVDHPSVLYRWLRGPERRGCVFHPGVPAKIGDLRSGQEFCCLDCFNRGHLRFGNAPPHARWELQRIFTRDLDYEMVGTSKSFVPSHLDVNRFLRLEITGDAGSPVALVTAPVITPPTTNVIRRWVHGQTGHVPSGYQPFRVLNWNILAQLYATEQEYPYVPRHVLSWGYRKHLILREILGYRPDIITLQEVQQEHYEDTLLPILTREGYDGVYLKKTNMVFTTKYTVEGCAILYRRQRFNFVERVDIEFNQLANEIGQKQGADRNQLTRLMKGNVALLVLLEDRLHGGEVCATNTHIIASPEHTDVKLWQADALLRTLDRELAARQRVIPTVLCGDFNSEPTSAVYQLVHEGGVQPDHPELLDPHGLLTGLDLQHSAAIKSAYRCVMGHEAPFTNWAARNAQSQHETLTLDYVFFDARLLRPTATLEVAPPHEPLPNKCQPSDHVPVVVDFCLHAWDAAVA